MLVNGYFFQEIKNMSETVIHVRGTRRDVRRIINQAAAAASGKSSQAQEIVEGMQTRIGMVALGHIRDAFVTKARGGTDESGLSWPPLKRSTIAYSRRHPGVPKSNIRAAFRPSWMLTDKQRNRWWEVYRRCLASTRGDTGKSAQIAWATVKREGATTLLEKYGDTQVEILRDTGLLLNSLSPGVSPGSVENQVFRLAPGEIIIGTNRKWAGTHHHGTARIPQRRLWPSPENWPESWWKDIAAEAKQGYIDCVLFLLKNHG